ncbi:hypothetical protein QYE76_018845 [Lolium multiflorum]|uniref:Uncharacterized protein n=1 Tax=Lolium multiflorum TaxID=4521 RepID=A0AAD8QDW7_LOLMU|nr:hypothetical protein QYE76_018845 [Lolium multiflorum]
MTAMRRTWPPSVRRIRSTSKRSWSSTRNWRRSELRRPPLVRLHPRRRLRLTILYRRQGRCDHTPFYHRV